MKNSRWLITLFFILNLLISSFYIDVWHNGNAVSRALPIITWYESGTFSIDKYQELTPDKAHVKGHYFTDKAPLPTYFVLPFFGLVKSFGWVAPHPNGSLFGDEVLILGGILAGSIPFSIMMTLLFIDLKKRKTKISPVLLSTLPFYGSFMFIFAGTYFGHLFAGLLLLGSYLLLKRKKYILSGLLAGLTFISEYNLAVLIFCWAIILLLKKKKLKPLILFSMGVLPSIILILFYNAEFSTSPFVFLYKYHNYHELFENYGFRLPSFESIWGLTFSPYRGVFFYVPILIAGFPLIYKKIKSDNRQKIWKSYLFVPSFIYFIFIASYFGWWGGWTYGPRLLMGLTIILLYEVIVRFNFVPKSKWFFILLVSFGLLVIILAKVTIVYNAPTGKYFPFKELVLPKLFSGNINPNNFLSLYTGISPLLASFIFVLLMFLVIGFLYLLYRKKFANSLT